MTKYVHVLFDHLNPTEFEIFDDEEKARQARYNLLVSVNRNSDVDMGVFEKTLEVITREVL